MAVYCICDGELFKVEEDKFLEMVKSALSDKTYVDGYGESLGEVVDLDTWTEEMCQEYLMEHQLSSGSNGKSGNA